MQRINVLHTCLCIYFKWIKQMAASNIFFLGEEIQEKLSYSVKLISLVRQRKGKTVPFASHFFIHLFKIPYIACLRCASVLSIQASRQIHSLAKWNWQSKRKTLANWWPFYTGVTRKSTHYAKLEWG